MCELESFLNSCQAFFSSPLPSPSPPLSLSVPPAPASPHSTWGSLGPSRAQNPTLFPHSAPRFHSYLADIAPTSGAGPPHLMQSRGSELPSAACHMKGKQLGM